MTKRKVDSAITAEMRYRALQNLGGSQKRQRKDEVENETAPRPKRRRSGSDTVAYFKKRTISCRKGKWKKRSYRSSDWRLTVRRRSSPKITLGSDAGHAAAN